MVHWIKRRASLFNTDRIGHLYKDPHEKEVNFNLHVGVGEDISIGDLALLVRELIGFQGEISYDGSKPDGTPRKRLDVSRLDSLGWRAKTGLKAGIEKTYKWYIKNCNSLGIED